MKASAKGQVQLALIVIGLWPLLTARPPLALLAPQTRRKFLENRFVDEIRYEGERQGPAPARADRDRPVAAAHGAPTARAAGARDAQEVPGEPVRGRDQI